MDLTKTDKADIDVSDDEPKLNFPENRSGYRKFHTFGPGKFSNLIRSRPPASRQVDTEHPDFTLSCFSVKVFLIEVCKQFFLGFNQLSKHLIEKIKKTTFINPTFK